MEPQHKVNIFLALLDDSLEEEELEDLEVDLELGEPELETKLARPLGESLGYPSSSSDSLGSEELSGSFADSTAASAPKDTEGTLQTVSQATRLPFLSS